ncbi:DUF3806 domain-containing protein [Myroides pelagicus]|uniref:DUF3806 domain-containing protein n=1 Tax=Myroides pelagicus TaxID=270914 RepID=A0A7K1GIF8_9FLAO|nr:DUF3806 domain-containing protein [Myroides pelagicus]MEC4112887.1 DUF3806 domain-containing protein [Myroides pelagicus]MTH28697.1 DUF3806 domain-containing protein [Myroides pelagicus]
MKIFEIGNGQAIMMAPSHYYCAIENEQTLQIYRAKSEDEPIIRVSLLSLKQTEQRSEEQRLTEFKTQAKEHKTECICMPNKAYYSYDSNALEDVYMKVYEVMFGDQLIIVSLSATKGTEGKEDVLDHLVELKDMVESIDALASLELPLLEPTYNDMYYMSQEIANLFLIKQESVDEYYTSGKAIKRLQEIFNDRELSKQERSLHFTLGMAFGIALIYKYPDLHWVVVNDQYGRELALQYQNLAIQCFPISMIVKHIEDGEAVNIEMLLSNTHEQILATLKQEEDYKYLAYNY